MIAHTAFVEIAQKHAVWLYALPLVRIVCQKERKGENLASIGCRIERIVGRKHGRIDQKMIQAIPVPLIFVRALHLVFTLPFLLTNDPNEWQGVQPRRMFLGDFYKGGVSDHLPLVLTLRMK